MTDEILDHASEESFPASDPPGTAGADRAASASARPDDALAD